MSDSSLIREIATDLFLRDMLGNLDKYQIEGVIQYCLRMHTDEINTRMWKKMEEFGFCKNMGNRMEVGEEGNRIKKLLYYVIYGEELENE